MFDSAKFGNEINYGLQNGKAAVFNKANGQMKKLNNYSSLNESLRKQASQYGAKFEMFPMPKSNPNKRFKVVEEISTSDNSDYLKNIKKTGFFIFLFFLIKGLIWLLIAYLGYNFFN